MLLLNKLILLFKDKGVFTLANYNLHAVCCFRDAEDTLTLLQSSATLTYRFAVGRQEYCCSASYRHYHLKLTHMPFVAHHAL